MSTGQLSDEALQYLEEKHVGTLMEHLMHDLLLALPSDPLAFLEHALEANPPPKIVVAGPPAGGKGAQCSLIAKHTGAVHINTGDLLRAEVRAGTELGKAAAAYMDRGALVPDAIITQLLRGRLSQGDVAARGWLLDGFPRTRSQALSLQLAGVIPGVFIVLDVPDAVIVERCATRRVDPKTGTTYNTISNPPPAGLTVELRPDDAPESVQNRLRVFHRNMQEVLSCYPTAAVHVDGHRSVEEVFSEVKQIIAERSLSTS